jgi:hypothetical protein
VACAIAFLIFFKEEHVAVPEGAASNT